MFEKITKKFTNKFVAGATETVKEEINMSIGKNIPVILGIVTVCLTLVTIMDNNNKKSETIEGETTIVTNNYYFG